MWVTCAYSMFTLAFLAAVLQLVTATTFHHGNASTASNALLNASTANLLKTETCISVDELEEFDFRDDRNLEEEEQEGVPKPPKNANQEVALVFVGKEAKVCIYMVECQVIM